MSCAQCSKETGLFSLSKLGRCQFCTRVALGGTLGGWALVFGVNTFAPQWVYLLPSLCLAIGSTLLLAAHLGAVIVRRYKSARRITTQFDDKLSEGNCSLNRREAFRFIGSTVALGVITTVFPGCENFLVDDKRSPSSSPQEQLETARSNLSDIFPTISLNEWEQIGTIKSDDERRQIVEELSSLDNMWMPHGDLSAPEDFTALLISENESEVDIEKISELREDIDDKVRVGHTIFRLDWAVEGVGSFSTKAIADEESLVYDSMLFNIFATKGMIGTGKTSSSVKPELDLYKLEILLLWFIPLGEAEGSLSYTCNPDGTIRTCNCRHTESMTFGTAKAICKRKAVQCNGVEGCDVEWDAAIGSATVSIEIDANLGRLEISGIGTTASAGGNITRCCHDQGGGG